MKIKFITLNIFNGNFLDRCIDFLKKENPDIFVLQEVFKGGADSSDKRLQSFEIIRKTFNQYVYFYVPEYFKIINKLKIESGNAIFSRFPILQKKSIYYSRTYSERKEESLKEFVSAPRNLQFCQAKINNKILSIFNTHGVWGLDGKDNKQRFKMSETICAEVKNLKNAILAGDFNLSPDTAAVKNIGKYLVNTFKDELKTSFNMKIKIPFIKTLPFFGDDDIKGFSKAVVDMIFVSPYLKVLDHYQPKVDVSDHYPLVIEIEI